MVVVAVMVVMMASVAATTAPLAGRREVGRRRKQAAHGLVESRLLLLLLLELLLLLLLSGPRCGRSRPDGARTGRIVAERCLVSVRADDADRSRGCGVIVRADKSQVYCCMRADGVND